MTEAGVLMTLPQCSVGPCPVSGFGNIGVYPSCSVTLQLVRP
jgi:hypothetical protein